MNFSQHIRKVAHKMIYYTQERQKAQKKIDTNELKLKENEVGKIPIAELEETRERKKLEIFPISKENYFSFLFYSSANFSIFSFFFFFMLLLLSCRTRTFILNAHNNSHTI